MTRLNRARKGKRIETEIVELHRECGIEARRVPRSGALDGGSWGDVVVLERLRAEVKARANGEGFRTLDGWLGQNDLLFLRRDRAKPIVLMTWQTYAELMAQVVPQRRKNPVWVQ